MLLTDQVIWYVQDLSIHLSNESSYCTWWGALESILLNNGFVLPLWQPVLTQCFKLWSSWVTLGLSTQSTVCYPNQFEVTFDDLDRANNMVCSRSLYPLHIWLILLYSVESTYSHFVEHWVCLVPSDKRSVRLSRRCSKRFLEPHYIGTSLLGSNN